MKRVDWVMVVAALVVVAAVGVRVWLGSTGRWGQ